MKLAPLLAIAICIGVCLPHGARAFQGETMPPPPGPATSVTRTIGSRDAAFEIFSEGATTILVICTNFTPKTLVASNGRATFEMTCLAPSTAYECFAMGFRGSFTNPSPPGASANLSFATLCDPPPAPGPVAITGRKIGATSATFELSSPFSTGILAWCYGLGNPARAARTTVTPGATKETATLRVDGLVCGTTYECFFKNENGAENPLHASVSFKPAAPAAPLPAPKLRSLKKTGTTASFATTTVPCAIGYKIDCHIVGKTRLLARKIVLGKDAVRVALENLRPGTGYVCAISAIGGARKPGRALTVRFSTNK